MSIANYHLFDDAQLSLGFNSPLDIVKNHKHKISARHMAKLEAHLQYPRQLT